MSNEPAPQQNGVTDAANVADAVPETAAPVEPQPFSWL
jgi:hypothetical protein